MVVIAGLQENRRLSRVHRRVVEIEFCHKIWGLEFGSARSNTENPNTSGSIRDIRTLVVGLQYIDTSLKRPADSAGSRPKITFEIDVLDRNDLDVPNGLPLSHPWFKPSRWRREYALPSVFVIILAFSFRTSFSQDAERDKLDFFENKIRPALVKYCYECHSAESGEANGELLLDSRPTMLRGGTRGNVLNGESPDHTLFMKAVLYQDADLQMPPSGQLPAEVIEDFRAWIAQGAVDPRVEETRLTAGQPHATPGDRAASHWAYRAPELRPIPAIDSQGWVRDPIDAIVFEKQHARGIAPNPEADKRTLVRRLYYDLLGLPPTQEQIQTALMDESEAWYERLVDDLLQSPHFGERMARYWMDLTRFADTKGYVFMEDRAYPHAYRYRDWLIRSFNQDLPYNDFIKYQLAADRLDPENAQGHLDAMGMLTLGRRFLNNQNDIADDRIDVVTRGLLAMTVGCARCHDHKYDPVKMADYYSLHGVFVNSEEPGGDPSRCVWSIVPSNGLRISFCEANRETVAIRSNGNLFDFFPRKTLAL